jgi:hypothetical protein
MYECPAEAICGMDPGHSLYLIDFIAYLPQLLSANDYAVMRVIPVSLVSLADTFRAFNTNDLLGRVTVSDLANGVVLAAALLAYPEGSGMGEQHGTQRSLSIF